MKKLFKLVAFGIVAAVLQLPAVAAPVLDQNNPEGGGISGFCYTSAGSFCGQALKQDGSTISGAGVYISPQYWHADGTLTISIFSAYEGEPSGLIAAGSISFATGFSGWADVFWTPVSITPASSYYMVLGSDIGGMVAAHSSSPTYANGQAVYGGSKDGWHDFDLVFRTFADDGGAQQVPEPGSFALLGLGLAALGFAARRKRG